VVCGGGGVGGGGGWVREEKKIEGDPRIRRQLLTIVSGESREEIKFIYRNGLTKRNWVFSKKLLGMRNSSSGGGDSRGGVKRGKKESRLCRGSPARRGKGTGFFQRSDQEDRGSHHQIRVGSLQCESEKKRGRERAMGGRYPGKRHTSDSDVSGKNQGRRNVHLGLSPALGKWRQVVPQGRCLQLR